MKSSAEVGLEKIAQETIEEARVVLPGIQALFGFQLIAVFNERFQQLSAFEQLIHFTALLLIASAIGLIMTPAAYHRIAERSTVSKFFITLSSWLIAGAMVPLMLAICLEVYLLGRLVLGETGPSILVSGVLLTGLAAMWFVFPVLMRRHRFQG